jgi:hypothetical protein
MYHPKRNKLGIKKKCHMFDINEDFFNLFRTGGVALKASECTLPNGLKPAANTKLVCGTCGVSKFKISELTTEPVDVR